MRLSSYAIFGADAGFAGTRRELGRRHAERRCARPLSAYAADTLSAYAADTLSAYAADTLSAYAADTGGVVLTGAMCYGRAGGHDGAGGVQWGRRSAHRRDRQRGRSYAVSGTRLRAALNQLPLRYRLYRECRCLDLIVSASGWSLLGARDHALIMRVTNIMSA
eukprot:876069-Rhodomonas_salina.1